jgi:hypothetical protein
VADGMFPVEAAEEKQTRERSQRVDFVHGVVCSFEEKTILNPFY